jgi:curli production assembly/transport component CsgG
MNFASGAALGRVLGGVLGLAMLAGCQTADVMETPISQKPVITPVTAPNSALRDLPPPSRRVPVAVYDFPDLTGQFKELQNVQTLSKAVTQGGAPMLIKALQDAGERRWFTVLDRARLDDILKERQIVTEMRRIYRNEQQISASALQPLRHASIILEGGIIGYDTNTMTGGLGARYLGIGADSKWQQDTVTVTLRAVSTDTGEVLASVTIHKMIASTSLQGGAFRYVMLDRILEAEGGVTQNEPKQIAVQQAIEKAVKSLIIEGADLGVWSFQDRAAGMRVIEAYKKEKYGEKLTAAAENTPVPDTVNPTRVVETVPIKHPVARARVVSPRSTIPESPPAPAKGETVGSVEQPVLPQVVAAGAAPGQTDASAEPTQHIAAISVAMNK